ncbi:MAG: tripartite tricarboxylate transporter substrate binding protein [Burkholderiales bacterium]|nr:tripartite tricarboxylate transporter substrate binding protein [Burkholderiales bacterium]
MVRLTPKPVAVLLALGLVLALAAPVDSLPLSNRPIRIVVPFPPGGSTDVIARTMGRRLSEKLGQDVVVENRAGGATVPGVLAAVKAPADGHTLLLTSDASFAINPYTIKDLAYDPLKDLAPVMVVGTVPNWLVVRADRPEKTFADLIDTIRRSPGKVSLTMNAPGSTVHIMMTSFKQRSGLDFELVAYKGLPPALTDLYGGHVTGTIDLVAGTAEHVRDGKLRPLVLFDERRSPVAPDVPIPSEFGQSIPPMVSTFAYFTTAGTPPAVVARLHGELAAIAREPEIAARLKQMGIDASLLSPADSVRYVREQYERFGRVIRETGFKVD